MVGCKAQQTTYAGAASAQAPQACPPPFLPTVICSKKNHCVREADEKKGREHQWSGYNILEITFFIYNLPIMPILFVFIIE